MPQFQYREKVFGDFEEPVFKDLECFLGANRLKERKNGEFFKLYIINFVTYGTPTGIHEVFDINGRLKKK